MKRITLMLFAAILFVSFAACSGSKKEEAPEKAETEAVEEKPAEAPAYVAQTPEEALKAFTEFSKEYIDAFNNMTKDPAKFQKLGSQLQQKVADMERLKVNFTEKQQKEYQKSLDLITQANTVGKK